MTRPHIPLVEDDPEISGPPKQFLGTYGFVMTVSTNAVEAIELLAGGEVDLVLFDLMLPGREVPSHDALINLTCGEGFAIATRSVDILVTDLRHKLAGDDPLAEVIRTVRTDGNAFQPQIVIE
jgi:DNA-binding response OmpR family regulator